MQIHLQKLFHSAVVERKNKSWSTSLLTAEILEICQGAEVMFLLPKILKTKMFIWIIFWNYLKWYNQAFEKINHPYLLTSSSWSLPFCVLTHCSNCSIELVLWIPLPVSFWLTSLSLPLVTFCSGSQMSPIGLCSLELLTCKGLYCWDWTVMVFDTTVSVSDFAGCNLMLLILVKGLCWSCPSVSKPYLSVHVKFVLSIDLSPKGGSTFCWLFWSSGFTNILWFATWLVSCRGTISIATFSVLWVQEGESKNVVITDINQWRLQHL